MATRFSSRFLPTSAKQTISSAFSRHHSSHLLTTPTSRTSSLVWLRPLIAVAADLRHFSPTASTVEGFVTRQMSEGEPTRDEIIDSFIKTLAMEFEDARADQFNAAIGDCKNPRPSDGGLLMMLAREEFMIRHALMTVIRVFLILKDTFNETIKH
ncbi:unnamed protein product [Ilex paraguariensis]|uniref:Uncharacterized protein n=1 Tax=Ilex paraguariensis TaxID=185542 RepID=A0ABC8RTK8_9AQUA